MDLIEAMRTTGTCRRFRPDRVPDRELHRAFEAARFAPQGGNRQPLSWVVVRDAAKRRQLGAWYLPLWLDYLRAHGAPLDRSAMTPRQRVTDDFARAFGEHPLLVVACARIDSLYVTDAGLGRVSVVGGASIYPSIQNLCLALRDAGIGSAVTTMLGPREREIKALLEIPQPLAIAACIVVGYPARPFPTQLRRRPVDETVFLDAHGGASITP